MTREEGRAAVAPPADNRLVTRFVMGFAAISCAASLAPLVAVDVFGRRAPAGFGRDASLACYLAALLLWAGAVLPGGFARDRGARLTPWWALIAFAGMFAAVPAVVAAYVSGVAAPDLAGLAAIPATVAGAALLLRAALGARAPFVIVALTGLLLVAAPGVVFVCDMLGARPPGLAWLDATPAVAAWRGATRRGPVHATPWMIAAAATWAAAPFVARRARAKASSTPASVAVSVVAVVALVAPAFSAGGAFAATSTIDAGASADAPTFAAPLGPWTRAGARTPVVMSATGGEGATTVALRTEVRLVPADGAEHAWTATPRADDVDFEVTRAGATVRRPLPFAAADPARLLVAVGAGVDAGAVRAAAAAAGRPLEVVALSAEASRPEEICARFGPAAYESFDVLALLEPASDAPAASARRAAVERYAALGGTAAWVGGGSAPARPFGQGRLARARDASEIAAAAAPRRRSDPFDATLLSLFARPDWQRLDLTKLTWFLLAYHAAFVAAFLLPWRLDGHKTSAVYLASVGFTLAATAFGARAVLRCFFLRDNQVYTQAFTLATFDGAGDTRRHVLRQYRCFASMSGEERDLPIPPGRDVVVYRDPSRPAHVFDETPGSEGLADAPLDRRRAKVLMREDVTGPPPLRLEADAVDGARRLRLRPEAAAEDPTRLRLAAPRAAWVLEPDGRVTPGRPDGDGYVFDGGPRTGDDLPAEVRALLGRYASGFDGAPPPGPRAVFLVDGAARLDGTEGYFHVEDRGAALVFELP
ncbi:MAG TPA: hypothetical protein VEI02_03125 [Planctomycetota bacterium]|nr:hypothetical protein [Planctomycetota bacterium]